MHHIGLLILRVGLGISFVLHGLPKISGGSEVWANIGGAMGVLGIHVFPTGWGLMAALSEFGGGLLLIMGLVTRYASGAMVFTMCVAASMHLSKGDNFMVYSHAIEAGVAFLAICCLGAGKYSVDEKLFKKP